MTLPRRTGAEELLDAPSHEPAELAHSLRQITAVNRWLGGRRSLVRHLRASVPPGRAGTILDVGTGNAALLRDLVAWAGSRAGAPWRGVGLDLHPQAVAGAGSGNFPIPITIVPGHLKDEDLDAVA